MVQVIHTLPLVSVLAVNVLPLNRLVDIINHQKEEVPRTDFVTAASQCWQVVDNKYGFVQQKKDLMLVELENPGDGLRKIKPFKTVLKDGMLKLGCFSDSMYLFGDKFGNNKHEYRIGASQNVSIVHYDDHVAKEDREKMTPTVCFNFCRTVEGMGYFGILNGGECYCEPYYSVQASDSSECDSVCEGDNAQMCGGKSKSNIWEMHYCNDGAQQLAVSAIIAYSVQEHFDVLLPKVKAAAEGQKELAEQMQASFGNVGDPDAANLMQAAKVAAGDLMELHKDSTKIRDNLKNKIQASKKLNGINPATIDYSKKTTHSKDLLDIMKETVSKKVAAQFLNFKIGKEGDELTQELDKITPLANKSYENLQKAYSLVKPSISKFWNVVWGTVRIDDEGCLLPRLGDDGLYMMGDWAYIEAIGEFHIEVKNWDLAWYDYEWSGTKYQYPSAWFVTTKNWGWYGSTLDKDTEALAAQYGRWWKNGNELSEEFGVGGKQTFGGAIYWWTWWWNNRKTGFKICPVSENNDEKEKRGVQYYPAMYFVDKEQKDVPMTCVGDIVEKPIYFKNYNGCAAACDARNQHCVGFSYFPTKLGESNLCFLFSNFKTGQYYTGCPKVKSKSKKFLQLGVNVSSEHRSDAFYEQPLTTEPQYPVCMAKLSKFVGTTLKPDPEGKCKQCFNELTQANRCWK